ncbi:hypothetical protein AS181_03460 [Gordonia sp. SGD-V-85]|nr:hypothetical protein AS181_03460 [Gordonia sp. SGD-V-85]
MSAADRVRVHTVVATSAARNACASADPIGPRPITVTAAWDGIVHREVYQEVPPRVVYSLTPKGAARDRALAPLGDWGEEHMQTITAARR